ncbi:MAG: sugar phosphate isomerase/epimerase family protein [Acutalibacteraceae bacterium]|jgi:3-dehydroshikimate dehydratase
MIGLTSITFRQLTVEQIVDLCKKSEVDGIEWGGDVHVKPGDEELAKRVGELTRAAGLRVLSYGSYLHVDGPEHIAEDFAPVLRSALALGAPVIRVWPGGREPDKADEAYYDRNAQALRIIGEMAAEKGIVVATEYHRGTLTQNADSALKLMRKIDLPNVKTYWQPNPDISPEENAREAAAVRPYLANVHVFQWTVGNVRYPLSDGEAVWPGYLKAAALDHTRQNTIIEFVKDDRPEQFLEDAATLSRWVKEG